MTLPSSIYRSDLGDVPTDRNPHRLWPHEHVHHSGRAARLPHALTRPLAASAGAFDTSLLVVEVSNAPAGAELVRADHEWSGGF